MCNSILDISSVVKAANSMLDCAEFEVAEYLISHLQTEHPENHELLKLYAEIAMRQRDFPTALRRWSAIEAVISHVKHDFRMLRNYLKSTVCAVFMFSEFVFDLIRKSGLLEAGSLA